jgi:hypothetical protein
VISISNSVGNGGANVASDVVAVKGLLNQCGGLIGRTGPLAPGGVCEPEAIQAIFEFQRVVMRQALADGRVDPNGGTLGALNTCAAGGTFTPKGLFTADPLERITKATKPEIFEMVSMLKAAWPGLGETGARVLTAQSMAETGDWRFCFNWNLGNVKATKTQKHMYLRGVWECYTAVEAKAEVAKSGGLGRLATAEESKKKGWSCPGKVVVAFEPPHVQCRFRAYDTLAEGAQKWMEYHQTRAAKTAGYLPALNAGDVATVVRTLKAARYFTADEGHYRKGMENKLAAINKALAAKAAGAQ